MLTVACSGLALMALLFGPLLFVHEPRTPSPHVAPTAAPRAETARTARAA